MYVVYSGACPVLVCEELCIILTMSDTKTEATPTTEKHAATGGEGLVLNDNVAGQPD